MHRASAPAGALFSSRSMDQQIGTQAVGERGSAELRHTGVAPAARRRSVAANAWWPAGALVLISAGAVALALRPAALEAVGSRPSDLDRDGLVCLQESVLETNPALSDSDGDGFSDSEELARGSDPRKFDSVPAAGALAVGLTAHGTSTDLRLVGAFYIEDGVLGDKPIRFGALVAGRIVEVNASTFLASSTQTVVRGASGNSKIVVLEIPLQPNSIYATGSVSFFATIGSSASGVVEAADSVKLVASNGTIYLEMSHVEPNDANMLQYGTGSGLVYKPIYPLAPGNIPATMSLGQICYQFTQIVGVSGATVTHEVVSSDCLPDWDAYCAVECSMAVGDTFRSIDPSVLVGL